MVKLAEIARQAGVSPATVSKVLNQRPDVGTETRQRILDLVKQNGFEPKGAHKETSIIGLFTLSNISEGLDMPSPFFSSVLQGIFDVVFDYGYNLEVVSLRHMPKDAEGFQALCRERGICAGIYLLTTVQDDFVIPLSKVIPTVLIGDKHGEEVDYIRSNNVGSAYMLAQYLLELGHRRFAVVVDDLRYTDHRERLDGYRSALLEASLDVNLAHILDIRPYPSKVLAIMNWLRGLLAQPEPPTAILTTNDLVAMQTNEAIRALGLSIPDDLSLVGHDDDPVSAHLDPPLTTVRQANREMGQAAVKRLLHILEGKSVDKRQRGIILEGQLVVRRSCRSIETNEEVLAEVG